MKPKKLYKIGEVMKFSRMSRQTIHNYTMLGLINPVEWTESGHRLYDETVFDRLEKIERFKRHHTLVEVKELLDRQEEQERLESQDIVPEEHSKPDKMGS